MAKYHNSPNGPRLCKAQKDQCPYGRAGGEHYATQAEAQEAYEAKMTEAFGITKKFNKIETTRQKHYQRLDRFKAYVTKVTDAATKAKADVMSAFSAETRERVKAKALAKAKEARHTLSTAAARQVAEARSSFEAATQKLKDDFMGDPRSQAALAAMRQSKQEVLRVKASIADAVSHAKTEGYRMIADGHAVATYANYSLKKRFLTYTAKAAQATADKANLILESKYTRQIPAPPEAPASSSAWERPRYILPEKAARAFVVAPAGEVSEVTFMGVPEAWTSAKSEAKEKALA